MRDHASCMEVWPHAYRGIDVGQVSGSPHGVNSAIAMECGVCDRDSPCVVCDRMFVCVRVYGIECMRAWTCRAVKAGLAAGGSWGHSDCTPSGG